MDRQRQLANLLEWTRDENCTLTEQGKFLAQVEIYKELLYNNSLMNLNTSYDGYLQDFYTDEANTNVGRMAQVKYNMDAEDYEEAEDINSTITPENLAAANERTTNEIYLATWAKDIYTLTESQYSMLLDIAEQNPVSGGPAVYTARVMLGLDFNDYGDIGERLSKEKQIKESFMHIYPNPTSDELNIAYSLGENETGMFVLCDVTGREVFIRILNSVIDKITISTKVFEQGIYFAGIKQDNEVISTEKLVIVK